ncbi:MAG: hypothetical protein Q9217_006770 [Psora testacea]
MEDRPIFTRRSLPNCIPGDEWQSVSPNVTRYLYQYLGYFFASGPWRDAVVKFGVDPRTDPKYRIYQTMMFVVDSEPKDSRAKYSRPKTRKEKTEQELRKESHLFDGVNVSGDGKVWQVCDVTDPLIRDLLATENLREKCHLEGDGWYQNGTWAKVKTIMKWKITAILTGTEVLSDYNYARVARDMPDIIERSVKRAARLTFENPSSEERTLASQIRTASTQYQIDKMNRLTAKNSSGVPEDDREIQGRGGAGEELVAQGLDEESGYEGIYGEDEAAPIENVIDPSLEDPRVLEAIWEVNRVESGTMQSGGISEDIDI